MQTFEVVKLDVDTWDVQSPYRSSRKMMSRLVILKRIRRVLDKPVWKVDGKVFEKRRDAHRRFRNLAIDTMRGMEILEGEWSTT